MSPDSEVRLDIDDRTWVLVLTGAGVSAESGVPTFRDANGLWEQHRVEDVASPDGFRRDPQLVWRFYSQRRQAGLRCQPNPGHHALAALERRLGERFLLVTQNVDELHRRAGSQRLVEIHGRLFQSRCEHCDRPPFDDQNAYEDESHPPLCEVCQRAGRVGLLRPHIVWFGELLDPAHMRRVAEFMQAGARQRLVFLAAGTSGAVYPAAGMVLEARRAGAKTWLVNADPPDNVDFFQHFIQGKSGEVLPRLLA
jgi:NAD-dependent deacetylase